VVIVKLCHVFSGGFCGAVDGVDHGYVTNTTSVLFEGRVTYKCFEGFTLSSTTVTSCSDNRKWNDQPTCKSEYL